MLYLQFLQFCGNCGLSPSVSVFSSSLISSPSSVGTEALWCEAAGEATTHAPAATISTNCCRRLDAVASHACNLAKPGQTSGYALTIHTISSSNAGHALSDSPGGQVACTIAWSHAGHASSEALSEVLALWLASSKAMNSDELTLCWVNSCNWLCTSVDSGVACCEVVRCAPCVLYGL